MGVAEVGEPFDLGRHVGEPVELGGGQEPVGGIKCVIKSKMSGIEQANEGAARPRSRPPKMSDRDNPKWQCRGRRPAYACAAHESPRTTL